MGFRTFLGDGIRDRYISGGANTIPNSKGGAASLSTNRSPMKINDWKMKFPFGARSVFDPEGPFVGM